MIRSRSLLPMAVAPVLAILAATLPGCRTLDKKKDPDVRQPEGSLRDQNQDTSYQAFLSRLRKAAARRDTQMLSTMMTPNFGYSWAPGGEGPGVFAFWERHNLWPELNLILKEKFVASGDYMVAPAQVTTDPDYGGYRAGLRLVNGSWRFAYFVSAPPAELKEP